VKRIRFFVKGIACDVYYPEDIEPNGKAGLYLHGFPGSIGVNIVIAYLLNEGYTVLQPHYPGTYDSDGRCEPETAISMIKEVAQGISDGRVENIKKKELISIPKNIEICVGHSFGCFVALRGSRYLPSLKTLILLGPAITYGSNENSCGLKEDGDFHVNYVRRSRPFTYRLGSTAAWRNLYRGTMDVIEDKIKGNAKYVIGIVGTEDKYFDLAVLRENFENIIRAYIPSVNVSKLIMVENASHDSKTLLRSGTINRIRGLIKDAPSDEK